MNTIFKLFTAHLILQIMSLLINIYNICVIIVFTTHKPAFAILTLVNTFLHIICPLLGLFKIFKSLC